MKILSELKKNPRIKLRALRHVLYSQHEVNAEEWGKKIADFFNNWKSRSDAHALGVSSFGTLVTMLTGRLSVDVAFASAEASVDTPVALPGWHVDKDSGRVLVLSGTIKMGMMAWEQGVAGYGTGQLGGDITFKINKEEGIDLMTFGTQDVTCKGKLVCFGPTTHHDAAQFHLAGDMIYEWITLLVVGVRTRSLPSTWSSVFCNLIYNTYASRIDHLPLMALTYQPSLIADDDLAIPKGLKESKLKSESNLTDWPHLYRAISDMLPKKMNNPSEERVTAVMMDVTFIHECYDRDLKVHQMRMTYEKWVGLNEKPLADYLRDSKFNRCFSHCDRPLGVATNTCALEAAHGKTLKSAGAFDSIEGLGTVMERTCEVLIMISRDMTPLSLAPLVPQKIWVKAQKLVARGWQNLGFKMGNLLVFPSEDLLNKIPSTEDTVSKIRAYIKVWCNEYIAMRRNPKTFKKLTDKSWDLDVLNDMMFSFWVIEPIASDHLQAIALKEKGILYTCNCPEYNHYHRCKHTIAVGLWKKEICVPIRFSTETVGKRKASAGASLHKRSKCLVIDA